ncbi:MAG: hypothetical protein WCF18_11190 [Chthoniobacteraceae bacterium]
MHNFRSPGDGESGGSGGIRGIHFGAFGQQQPDGFRISPAAGVV